MSVDFVVLLGKAIPVLDAFAAFTPTHYDNYAVGFLKAVYESPVLIEWLQGLFTSAGEDGTLSLIGEPGEDVALALRDRKFDWAKVVEMLPTILAILKAFAK